VLFAVALQHLQFAAACNALGEFEQIVARYANVPWIRDMALLRLNRFDAPELTSHFRNIALLLRGQPEQVLARTDNVEALLATGRFEEVLVRPFTQPEEQAAALRGLGRLDEAVRQADARALAEVDAGEEALAQPQRLHERMYLLHHLALRALFSGQVEVYRKYRDQARRLPCSAVWLDVWFHRHLLLPLADELCGERGAFERSLRVAVLEHRQHWYGKLFYLARFVLGESSEPEFTSQPCGLFCESRLVLGHALRAELLGDRTTACEHYRAFLELPALARRIDSAYGDPLIERWASFRRRELSVAS
jgi:hypothetical protein